MTRRRRRAVMVGLLIGSLAGPWGCTTYPHRIPPLSEQVRAEVGTLGVAASKVVPTSALEGPTTGKGSGAAKGAGLAAGSTVLGGMYLGGAHTGNAFGMALGLALGLGLAPVAAVVGGIYGAVVAEPAEKVKEAETALARAFADLKVQEAIRDHVRQTARDRTAHRVVSLAEIPDVDTILEVSVPLVMLAGPTAVNPPLSLVVHACPRLVRRADGAELYPAGSNGPHAPVHASAPRMFVEWGAEDARLFREEMERAYRNLAEKVVEDMFLVFHPPGRRWSAVGPAPLRAPACPPPGGEGKR